MKQLRLSNVDTAAHHKLNVYSWRKSKDSSLKFRLKNTIILYVLTYSYICSYIFLLKQLDYLRLF